MLENIKTLLGITTDYQDSMLQLYIDEVIQYLLDAGVSQDIIDSGVATGIIARGVSDLWNYGSGGTRLSNYFMQRAIQLVSKSRVENSGDDGDDDTTTSTDYNSLQNKPEIEEVILEGDKSLTDFGLGNLTNSDIFDVIGD